MDVVGSEIGQKMRSAIKAKLTELGCYVDDELPDYVMVMVANKRTRVQMEDDLQLFLTDNTVLFVNWLHQVLKKLQEVTVATPAKSEHRKSKERSKSKEHKLKDKKHKEKKKKGDNSKKSKKKSKEKSHRKKGAKIKMKVDKSKLHDIIRPNIPPLLMNMEKDSEPSITDVFAGQILKNHGVAVEEICDKVVMKDVKPFKTEIIKAILPVIDPATIEDLTKKEDETSSKGNTEAQLKEMNKIEEKIQGLKQKLSEQLTDSTSEDDDFLNIRTEAEELLNDFADDVLQETSTTVTNTPPVLKVSRELPSKPVIPESSQPIETLPLIELNLPKRPIRDRLGEKCAPKKADIEIKTDVVTVPRESQERYTPEKEFRPEGKSAKSRLRDLPEKAKNVAIPEVSAEDEDVPSKAGPKRSEVSCARPTCASVVRVRPRPRVAAPASSLLMRAVADAHKSLFNIPPKVEPETTKVKRALVLPMRRCVDPQKIVIEVPCGDRLLDTPKETEYTPISITKKIVNNTYIPSRRMEDRIGSKRENSPVLETLNIHNTTVDKQKDTQFIVTMDGYHPNAFLAKKLINEGLFDDDVEMKELPPRKEPQARLSAENQTKTGPTCAENNQKIVDTVDNQPIVPQYEENKDVVEKSDPETPPSAVTKKRLSDTSDESDTQVIINVDGKVRDNCSNAKGSKAENETPPVKKRKASPIVFDINKNEKERVRKESASSDGHVTVITAGNHKYDNLKPLSESPRPACASFPLCRWGAACAFAHPPCRFSTACSRRSCPYDHTARPAHATHTASQVAASANYKTVAGSIPNLCKYHPNCANALCRFYHPRACRYGAACLNKLVCNFYHSEMLDVNAIV